MSCNKICSVFVTVFCVTSLVVANPVELIPRQIAARQQGGAVLFYVAFQGLLRDIPFDPIIFKEVIVNQGSAYNNDTGLFTAPVAGIYQFVFAAQLCRGDQNNVWNFMVNGVQKMACHAQVSGQETTLNTCYCMKKLKEGDQVWIKQHAGSCAWASTISKTITFSGVLLASEGVSTLGRKYGSGSSCPLPSLGLHRDMVSSSVGQRVSLSSVAITLLLCCLLWD
ncbi:complement C1q-like protein 4 [Cottoperca gobio]|uniref:Complement C1q-like protein 4 n=1 Tax=Cottoperca gobio TaxID=56716 RepID=A0A6J2Q6D0_COTGO|nr:complement C1q-like protein 4 [Cottoperca gobio]